MTGLNPRALADRIRALQDRDGRIRWIDAGLWDPWNHAEAAMGLMVVGDIAGARRALDHLAEAQRADGSWLAEMGCAAPLDAANRRLLVAGAPTVVDTNFCAYPAVAVWRLVLTTGDARDARAYAPMVERSLRFVAGLQRPDGTVPWRVPEPGEAVETIDALLAGGASIMFSLACGAAVLETLERPAGWMRAAAGRLREALARRPDRFAEKPRYAMDWYYTALTGAVDAATGWRRLAARWRTFVHPVWGCRCVHDEPWATAAETSELALTAAALGAREAARKLLASVARHDDGHGGLWMGRQFQEDRPWPEERPSWTAGAALMALDAVEGATPAAGLFCARRRADAPAAAVAAAPPA